MKTIFIIVLVVAVIAGAVWVGTKFFGLAKDDDKDGIPDVVEDKVGDAKKAVKQTTTKVKQRAKRVKEELKDVADAAKDVVNQAGDVVEAVKGGPRKGRKPRRRPASKSKGAANTSGGSGSDYYSKKR